MFPIWDVSSTQAGGWLRRIADPLGGGVYRQHVQYPAFAPDSAPGSSKETFGVFWSLCIFNPEFVWLCMNAVIFSLT